MAQHVIVTRDLGTIQSDGVSYVVVETHGLQNQLNAHRIQHVHPMQCKMNHASQVAHPTITRLKMRVTIVDLKDGLPMEP